MNGVINCVNHATILYQLHIHYYSNQLIKNSIFNFGVYFFIYLNLNFPGTTSFTNHHMHLINLIKSIMLFISKEKWLFLHIFFTPNIHP